MPDWERVIKPGLPDTPRLRFPRTGFLHFPADAEPLS